ncbi:helix-turn-helix domain-containing protein [Martelella radicis]|uniref:Transcriptional regulator with XRE-family HTH domain n=1 Tax=Martelella radicis TaxID=1397476 RepID=A0A7W6KG95_9HYPH|nr:helix-turn-helix transcriptional regulator [Martelella radicis]MBB4120542.1 transcriptional regulator with XRE-family HTH domain [Martelella radicis]
MITSHQIRAARALLGLSQDEAAAKTGVDRDAIAKAETDGGDRDFAVADALEKAFEKNGVAFIEDGEHGGGPGVRLARSLDPCDGIRPEDLNSTNDG